MTAREPEVIFARGGLGRLAARLGELGARRVLILCGPSRRFVDELAAALVALEPAIFDGARVHVPGDVVERAEAQLRAHGADTVIALGGGSAIGLGKALRLGNDVRFAAVPTTYAGSEMTSIYGVTRERDKQTGRDSKVRPDLVLYDATLGADLPIGLTVQSLMNAFAHVASALSTDSLAGDDRAHALDAAGVVVRAVEDLLLAPRAAVAREHALRGAMGCGGAADRGRFGAQHAIAHLLGGGLGLDHAALHAILLPQFLAHLRASQPELVDELTAAAGRADLEPHLYDLLVRAGAPTSLDALGADAAEVRRLLASRPELPAEIADDAQHGLRPTGRAGRIALGAAPLALLAGPPLDRARRIVVALHGRGAEAGGVVRRFRELAGHDADTAIVGVRTDGNRWYAVRYGEPGAGDDPEVARALARVDESISAIGRRGVILAGFSQGACLALEYAARRGAAVGLAAVIAPCGARLGAAAAWAPADAGALAGVPVVLGAADADRWIAAADLAATAAWFRAAGAHVDVLGARGDRHDTHVRLRLRARDVLLARDAPAGPSGFGNAHACEAIAGALPPRQNTPRLPPHGLYAEQLSGTGFTARRAANRRTWMYRIRPSTERRELAPLAHPRLGGFEGRAPAAELTGWAPLAAPAPDDARDFVDGLVTLGGAGSAELRRGYAIHRYAANRDMERRAFYDADGDLLIVPEDGALTLLTELGPLDVAPGAIAIVPRGLLFSVVLHAASARGWVAEAFGRGFALPERGPVGANGLADERHFHAPAPWFEDRLVPDFRVVAKLGGRLHEASQDHSPFDVVAWHGNHAPYVYDLADFSPVSSVRFDHADPSVYTVLGAPLDEPGAATLDLIVFPPRWDVTEGTFRPPFFHRNAVTELNGIVREPPHPDSPFAAGVTFLTPSMTAHGVSGRVVERIRGHDDATADRPMRLGGPAAIWFQLESALPMSLTPWAEAEQLPDWPATWSSHRSYFEP